MDTQALAHLLAEAAHGRWPSPEDAALMIQDTTARQQVLEYPELVAALISQASSVSSISCETVAEQLAAYVDAEHIGEHERAHYQPLRTHLKLCPLCYEDYALVRNIIAAQEAGAVPRWPLQAHAGIVLHRAALHHALRQQTLDGAWPIYDGAVPDLANIVAHVELTRPSADHTADWQLTIRLEGSPIAGLRIMLRYETELRIQRTDRVGCATFPDVPTRWLDQTATPDLLILFVADDACP